MIRAVEKYTYRITWSDEDGEFVGLCAELPGLSWLAKRQVDALLGIRQVVREAIRDMERSGEAIPSPLAAKKFSGKFTARVTPQTHRALAIEAAEAKVSFNRLVAAKLAQG